MRTKLSIGAALVAVAVTGLAGCSSDDTPAGGAAEIDLVTTTDAGTEAVDTAGRQLKDKVLFGSDFPVLTPDRWLADFALLDLTDDVRQRILKTNAVRLLGLT